MDISTRSSPGPRILLVEDDPQLGPLITELLQPDFCIELATDGRTGLHRGLAGRWDAMIIDRGLPGLDGLELIRTLRNNQVTVPVLILTALGSVGDTVAGLDAGANDYLAKPFDAEELAARLRALTRVYATTPRSVSIGAWELDPAARTMVSDYGHRVVLSPREADLMTALAQDPQRVFSRQELAATVFGSPVTPGAVDTYVHYLRRKLGKDIIHTVHGTGYMVGETT
ncbi:MULTISPECIES: response regulator transcription factor [unclassified Paenarthrobacter]|uniref:response regulator transcription factor n=1 Tax=unclassified Paenarthrobacter TaxID=2634190 RepID=UPI00084EA8D0|nr:response regulator transcription factor [Paenarthrobacter sp. R1]NKR13608.1 two-component system response regulator [Arthrobacter sp. M5]NKR15499.1 two-component system response regulator [Arthrobacter sp. M6]OEH58470.1 two-component system response regulator [Arthrobacter sp. D2]OEH64365.1 two-component system response regulator [Arthrobacter sp. D4]WIV29243.1 response regulator transcription factor [Paenarthrobacter sp. R1]